MDETDRDGAALWALEMTRRITRNSRLLAAHMRGCPGCTEHAYCTYESRKESEIYNDVQMRNQALHILTGGAACPM